MKSGGDFSWNLSLRNFNNRTKDGSGEADIVFLSVKGIVYKLCDRKIYRRLVLFFFAPRAFCVSISVSISVFAVYNNCAILFYSF
jgi:hypothetical protein